MRYLFVLMIAAIMFFPIYWMATTAVQNIGAIMRVPPALIPTRLTLDNFKVVFAGLEWVRWAANTVIVVSVTAVLSVAVSAVTGYALSTFRFRGRAAVMWALVWVITITRYALLIPLFVVNAKLGVRGLAAAILPCILSPVGILLFKSYCDSIPRSFVESARIDGAGEWRIIARVVAPLCGPVVGALLVFKSLEVLQDYVWQMLVLNTREEWSLLVGLYQDLYMRQAATSMKNIGSEAAVGCVLLAPIIAVFAFTSRYFTKGLTLGGVKE